MKILFQGDSITDAGRNYYDLTSLGNGYVNIICDSLDQGLGVEIINKGISGDRTTDLLSRWNEDTILIKPDVLTIMIGINDCWRRYDSDMPMTVVEYEENYRRLLIDFISSSVAHLILMEPFLLPVNEEQKKWFEDLKPKQRVVKRLSEEFGATFIPLQGIFEAAQALEQNINFTDDGVHPRKEADVLIAKVWIEVFESII